MSSFFSQSQPQTQPFGSATGSTGFGFGGFGTPAPNTSAFGSSSFPTLGTTTATSTFGGGTTTFGGFGNPTFPTPQQSTFGTPQQAVAPFGSGTTGLGVTQPTASIFGSTQPTVGFGTSTAGTTFGTSQGGSIFGSTQPQATSTFGGFGTQTTGGFGTLGGGTSTFGTTQQPSLFGTSQPSTVFGAPQQRATIFGAPQQTQGSTLFGATQPQTTSSFGVGLRTGGGLFGQPATGSSLFSQTSTFGQPQQSLFSQPAQQPQQQQLVLDEQAAFHASIFACNKFGDERDATLANLNYIQACWGSGQGHYNQSLPAVTYNDRNVYYRFKAVGYSFLYQDTNEDGQVAVHIKKPQKTVLDEETQLIGTLQAMLAKPHILFKITGSKAVNENITVIILVAEDQQTLRRILATDLAQALLQPQFKPALDRLAIVDVCPKVKPSPAQLKAYLEVPPGGLDPRVWAKAQEDNPDPVNMIPIPLLGPSALKNRLDAQQKESEQHSERLKLITDEVAVLQNRHVNITAEMVQLRRKHVAIAHRIVSAIARLQMLQRQGMPILLEEEDLRKKFGDLEKRLNSPKDFRGRLNELMSHVRLHQTALEGGRRPPKYAIEPNALEQIKDFLNLEQDCIKHLVDTVKFDVDCIQRMGEEMSEFQ